MNRLHIGVALLGVLGLAGASAHGALAVSGQAIFSLGAVSHVPYVPFFLSERSSWTAIAYSDPNEKDSRRIRITTKPRASSAAALEAFARDMKTSVLALDDDEWVSARVTLTKPWPADDFLKFAEERRVRVVNADLSLYRDRLGAFILGPVFARRTNSLPWEHPQARGYAGFALGPAGVTSDTWVKGVLSFECEISGEAAKALADRDGVFAVDISPHVAQQAVLASLSKPSQDVTVVASTAPILDALRTTGLISDIPIRTMLSVPGR